jgi:transcriptional regulator
MYSPSYYRQIDEGLIQNLIVTYNFGTMMVVGSVPPSVSHLPFLFARDKGEKGTLWGHLARANPQWKQFTPNQELLIVFQGPHAYISPTWYTPKADNVPTWDYAVVHAFGSATLLPDDEAYAGIEKMVRFHEERYQTGWRLDLPEKEKRSLLAAIVAFEIKIERWEAKFKFNQNHGAANIEGVIEGLEASGFASAREAGRFMREIQKLK